MSRMPSSADYAGTRMAASTGARFSGNMVERCSSVSTRRRASWQPCCRRPARRWRGCLPTMSASDTRLPTGSLISTTPPPVTPVARRKNRSRSLGTSSPARISRHPAGSLPVAQLRVASSDRRGRSEGATFFLFQRSSLLSTRAAGLWLASEPRWNPCFMALSQVASDPRDEVN